MADVFASNHQNEQSSAATVLSGKGADSSPTSTFYQEADPTSKCEYDYFK